MSRKIISKNPFTGEVNKEFAFASDEEIEAKINRAYEAFNINRKLPTEEKIQKLLKLASVIEGSVDKYAGIITKETGKPISESRDEVKKSAGHAKYYAEHLKDLLKPEQVQTEAKQSMVLRQPLGVIYQISPFNFPFWLSVRGSIPAIALGNSVLNRSSHSTPLTGLALEEIFKQAGYVAGEFQTVFAPTDKLEMIMKNNRIVGLEFTGSEKAGKKVAEIAAKSLKKAVLELGGSDPFVVLKDADLKKAAQKAIITRFRNAGQACNAGKRFIIEEGAYDGFVKELIEGIKKFKVGDPCQDDTELGPLATEENLEKIKTQYQAAIQQGATVLYNGEDVKINNKALFFSPKITEVKDINNILFQEETFGPILPLIKVKNADEALEIANNSKYGLGATLFTESQDLAKRFAEDLESGLVFVNEAEKSDSRLPFGGVKSSGFGRTSGTEGFYEFANLKPVWIS